MKLVSKTSDRVVLEVTETEMSNCGFDDIWDRVRVVYNKESFDIFSINKADNSSLNYPVEKIFIIELFCLKKEAQKVVA